MLLRNIFYIIFIKTLFANTNFTDIRYLIQQGCAFSSNRDSVYTLSNCKEMIQSVGIISLINSFFADTFIKVTRLKIISSNLDAVPEIICKMVNLDALDLQYNKITALPSHCLNNLTNLSELLLGNNIITRLEDGVFDNKKNLKNIDIKYNLISNIGTYVFSNDNDLLNLIYVDLSNNQLSEVDSWLFIRGQVTKQFDADLSHNSIERFTNKLNWSFTCSKMKNISLKINLKFNKIKHFLSIKNLFSNSIAELACFFHIKESHLNLKIDLSGNPFSCDCIEFDILRLYPKTHYQNSNLLTMNCAAPNSLLGDKLISVSLKDLICEIPCFDNCHCFKQPSNATFHVLCSNNSMHALPNSLPPTNKPTKNIAKYKLDFSWNPIDNLTTPSYLYNKTEWLDLSNCGLTSMTASFWLAIKNINTINLSGNKLQFLPQIVITEPGNFKSLSLINNSFSCGCADKWLQTWISKWRSRFAEVDGLLCAQPHWLKGKSILRVKDDEFCTDPDAVMQRHVQIYASIAAVVGAAATIVVATLLILYKCRLRLYMRFKVHLFGKDECAGEEMIYDAFLCSAKENLQETKKILKFLEETCKFKICYHLRDFVPLFPIADNIKESIYKSKRSIFLLSESFVHSNYCQYEFDVAFTHNLLLKKHRIILWLLSDLEHLLAVEADMDTNLKIYLRTHTYVNYPKIGWNAATNQLLYAMPQIKLGEIDSTLVQDHAYTGSEGALII